MAFATCRCQRCSRPFVFLILTVFISSVALLPRTASTQVASSESSQRSTQDQWEQVCGEPEELPDQQLGQEGAEGPDEVPGGPLSAGLEEGCGIARVEP